MNKVRRSVLIITFAVAVLFVTALAIVGYCVYIREPSSAISSSAVFRGEPKGGEVAASVSSTTVTISTFPSDSVTNVVQRVASVINTNPALREQAIKAQVDGDRIILTNVPEYKFFLCTTDLGLEIPPKPELLSCVVDLENSTVVLQWQNPGGGYDIIHIEELGSPIAQSLPGTRTSFIHNYLDPLAPPLYRGIHTFRVFGVKNETPSCATTCDIFLGAP